MIHTGRACLLCFWPFHILLQLKLKYKKITAPASETERLFFIYHMWTNRLSVAPFL